MPVRKYALRRGGGEIAQVREMIHGAREGYAFDLVASCIGTVKIDEILTGKDARQGDVIVGFTAPIVAWLNAIRSPAAPAATLVWNVFGIGDLVIAVGTGFLASPSPYQMLAFDRPNELIAQYPFVLVPIFFVPLSIIWRLTGKDPLSRKRADWPGWTPYPVRYRDRKHYERMY